MKGTESVSVRATETEGGESVKVAPERNGGARTGFTPIRNAEVVFDYDSPGQVGAAVIEVFAAATS